MFVISTTKCKTSANYRKFNKVESEKRTSFLLTSANYRQKCIKSLKLLNFV